MQNDTMSTLNTFTATMVSSWQRLLKITLSPVTNSNHFVVLVHIGKMASLKGILASSPHVLAQCYYMWCQCGWMLSTLSFGVMPSSTQYVYTTQHLGQMKPCPPSLCSWMMTQLPIQMILKFLDHQFTFWIHPCNLDQLDQVSGRRGHIKGCTLDIHHIMQAM